MARLVEEWKRTLARSEPRQDSVTLVLGDGRGNVTVGDEGSPVHLARILRGETLERVTRCFNLFTAPTEGMYVSATKLSHPTYQAAYRVTGLSSEGPSQDIAEPFSPLHAWTHWWRNWGLVGRDALNVFTRMLVEGRVEPTDPPSMSVRIASISYRHGTELKIFPDTTTTALTVSESMPQMALITFLPATNTYEIKYGTASWDPQEPDVVAGEAPLASILLMPDTTAIYDLRIKDRRDILTLCANAFTAHDPISITVALDTILSLTDQEVDLDTQAANLVLAGPVSGGAAQPTFRALVDGDIPSGVARDSEVTTAISDHAAIADAHHDLVTLGTQDPTGALSLSTQQVSFTLVGKIGDTHINWGLAAGQVSAVDVPLEDAGSWFTTDNVEAALQQLGAAGGHDPVTLAADADVLLGLTGQEINFDTQAANLVLAGPAAGGVADPTFRALVDADIPAVIMRDAEHTAIGDAAPHHAAVTAGDGIALTGQQVSVDPDNVTLELSATKAQVKYGAFGQSLTFTDGKYIAVDHVRAIDGDGLALYDDGGNGIFVKDGGFVGIGTSTPDYLVEIYSDAAGVDAGYFINVRSKSLITSSADIDHGQVAGHFTAGKKVAATKTDAGYVAALWGRSMRNYLTTADNGSLDALYGMYTEYGHYHSDVTATPTTTLVTGLRLMPYLEYGTIGTIFDLYADDYTGSCAVTNKFGLYILGSTKVNYFAGKIGLGTATPAYRLHSITSVATLALNDNVDIGVIMGDDDTMKGYLLYAGASGPYFGFVCYEQNTPIKFFTAPTGGSATERMRLDGDGYLSIFYMPHTTSGYYLKRYGTMIYYHDSTTRGKENIQPLDADCYRLLQAQPKMFTDLTSKLTEIGYIAEDFHELGLTELVIYDETPEGPVPGGIKYDVIPLYMLEIIRDLVQRVEALEAAHKLN